MAFRFNLFIVCNVAEILISPCKISIDNVFMPVTIKKVTCTVTGSITVFVVAHII